MPPEQFLKLANLLPDPILLVSGEGKLVAANHHAVRELAFPTCLPSELQFADVFTDPPEAIRSYLFACSNTESLVAGSLTWECSGGEKRRYRCEGSVFQPPSPEASALVLIRLLPKTEGQSRSLDPSDQVEALQQELRRRQQAEETLRASEARLNAIYRQAAVGIALTDLTGQFVLVNDRYCDMLGRSRDEMLRLRLQDVTHPEDLPGNIRFLKQLVAEDREFVIEKRYFRADGSVFWVRNSVSLVHQEEDHPPCILAISQDITDRKCVEDERDRLLAYEQEARRKLQQQAEELARANKQQREFLAVLGHELRNPLAGISNAIHALAQTAPLQDNSAPLRTIILRQTQLLSRLVDDLLDISRIMQGKLVLQKQSLDLVSVIQQALTTIRPLYDARHQRFSVSLPSEPMWMDGDPARLEQIILNLATNAAKYTEPGGRVWLTLEREGAQAVIRIRDTGVGISPELLPNVFDLFTQSPQALDRSNGGLGIGLSIVKNLVQLHGGSIEAYSGGSGRGSEFCIQLPLLPDLGAYDPELPEQPADAATQSRRVLLVEDNVDVAQAMATLLDIWGHEVQVVHDGIAAVTAAFNYRPEVILLDIGLPGMDGYEVARKLRPQADRWGTLLVALSGYGQQEDRCRSREAGFDYHLVKPVDIDQLSRLLEQSGEGKMERQQTHLL